MGRLDTGFGEGALNADSKGGGAGARLVRLLIDNAQDSRVVTSPLLVFVIRIVVLHTGVYVTVFRCSTSAPLLTPVASLPVVEKQALPWKSA